MRCEAAATPCDGSGIVGDNSGGGFDHSKYPMDAFAPRFVVVQQHWTPPATIALVTAGSICLGIGSLMPALHDAGDIPRANAGLLRMVKLFLSVGGSATISDEVLKWKNLRSAVKTTPATSVSA